MHDSASTDDKTADEAKAAVRIAELGPASLQKRVRDAKQRVVVLGGGFGGVYAAKYLTEKLGRRTDVHVELLSQENYFVFQPLLPEVAAGGINPNHVVNPIRDIVPKAQFRWCSVVRVDTAAKLVYAFQGEGRELVAVPYDHLVFGLGKISDFSSMPGVQEHALAMKDLADAFKLRNHVFRCLELADVEDDPAERQALLTFVVAGGGFSGVETVGELAELLERCVSQFHNIERKDIRVVLVHSRETLLPEMSDSLGDAAREILRRRGVELILGARVRAASRLAVYLNNGTTLSTRCFVCTVGNAANPIVRDILEQQGFAEGKVEGRGVGVFETDGTLACPGKPGYWAVGDGAGVPNPFGPGLCPATAQFAIRQAKTCAHNILATIDGRPLKQFSFKALGMLASLGSRKAVADVMGLKLSGFIAWFMWRTIYLSKLPGWARRTRVALDWTLDLFFPRDITQLQELRPPRLRIDHYEPGELILCKREVGRECFLVESGEVEVFEPDAAGAAVRVIATFGKGEVFGEKALLSDTPRTASVRAKTAVNVLVVGREDFRALVAHFPVLDDYFEDLMRSRYPELRNNDKRVSESMPATPQRALR